MAPLGIWPIATYFRNFLNFGPGSRDTMRRHASVLVSLWLFMAAVWNRAGHYIFILWFFLLSFFLVCSQLSHIECLPYFHTWCGLSVNSECRSERCCPWHAENTGRKISPKIRHLRNIAWPLCRAISLQLSHVSTIRKKLVKQEYVPHISLQYGELQPTSVSLGHPC